MNRDARLLPPLVVLLLAAGCGPKLREVSISVLVVAVAIVVLANALMWPLWRLWRRLRPGLEFRWRPFVAAGVVLSGVGLLAAELPYKGSMEEWLGLALWAVGTSYLTLLLLVWRLRLQAARAQMIGHVVAGTLMFVPALLLAFLASWDEALPDLLFYWWVIPGYAGIVTGVVFAGLLVEVLVRRRLAAKQP